MPSVIDVRVAPGEQLPGLEEYPPPIVSPPLPGASGDPETDEDEEDGLVECQDCNSRVQEGDTVEYDGEPLCEGCRSENYSYCEDCSALTLDTDCTSINHNMVCESCRDRNYHSCQDCDRYYPQDEGIYVDNHGSVCEGCQDNYSYCDYCEEYVGGDSVSHTADGDRICDYCYDNRDDWVTCESCSCRMPGDEAEVTGDDEDGPREWRCPSCSRGRAPATPRVIQNYSAKNKIKPKGKGPLYFGIELEVESRDKLTDAATVLELTKEHSILKEDGSLNSGFEIVSCPMTLEIHQSIWNDFFEKRPPDLRSHKTGTCGMHVHVSRDALSQLQLGKMLVFLNSPDNLDFISKIARRGPTHWAGYSPKKHADAKKYPSTRYEALNLSGEYTVEFRIFRGTLIKASFLRNLEFCAALVAFCGPMKHSITDCMEETKFRDFVAKERKAYPHLHNYIMEMDAADKPDEEAAPQCEAD